MYRIRLHGRGGQGIKTASRILGTALFRDGFEVQDAPRYGAERRGAPIFAYVRASRDPIHERGVIVHPDLVVVADDGLVPVASAGVVAGIDERSVLLINTRIGAEVWRERLALAGPIFTLAAEAEAAAELRLLGASCAGAAARCLGVITRASLENAVREELAATGERGVSASLERALAAWDELAHAEGCVQESRDLDVLTARPAWVDLGFEPSDVSAPDVHGTATSVEVRTGLWRTVRPIIDYEHCNRCSWMCSTFCPDSAISVEPDRTPRIDYDHCKGCMICAAVCPPHAIRAVPERTAQAESDAAERGEGAP